MMDMYSFFVYLSVIVAPDGEIKSLTMSVENCPTEEQVQIMHKPMMDSGEILTWSASCKEFKLPLSIPKGT